MESIGEQWNPSKPLDIISDSWMNIAEAKQAIKIWILDHGESWPLLLRIVSLDYSFTVSIQPAPSIFE
jgi:hypothetical protein